MADNLIANPGAGGPTFATDDIGGVHYPRSKQVWGADGVATDVAAGASALPVQDGGNSLTVDGTVSVTGSTVSISGTVPVSGTVSISGTVPVSGTVGISGTVPISGTVSTSGTTTVAGTVSITGALPAGTNKLGGVDVLTQPGAANLATGQVTVDTTVGGVTLAASRATRRKITVVNHGTTDVWVGTGTVSASTGLLLLGVKGAGITLEVTTTIKAIVGAGSQVVSYAEEYD